jgi:cytochrome b6-f complex iron-sulfur subunit
MDRKDFLMKGCALCGVTAMITYLDSCSNNNNNHTFNFTIDLSSQANAALANTGGYVVQDDAIVIKTSSGYNAYSLICTHAGCIVNYVSSVPDFRCPCHGSVFDGNGNVVSGPAPSPLQKLNVTQNGTVLTVSS